MSCVDIRFLQLFVSIMLIPLCFFSVSSSSFFLFLSFLLSFFFLRLCLLFAFFLWFFISAFFHSLNCPVFLFFISFFPFSLFSFLLYMFHSFFCSFFCTFFIHVFLSSFVLAPSFFPLVTYVTRVLCQTSLLGGRRVQCVNFQCEITPSRHCNLFHRRVVLVCVVSAVLTL